MWPVQDSPEYFGELMPLPSNLPSLLPGWVWRLDHRDSPVACLFTEDIDCFVSVEESIIRGDKSVKISTGVAPIEIVKAVIAANEEKERKHVHRELHEQGG